MMDDYHRGCRKHSISQFKTIIIMAIAYSVKTLFKTSSHFSFFCHKIDLNMTFFYFIAKSRYQQNFLDTCFWG